MEFKGDTEVSYLAKPEQGHAMPHMPRAARCLWQGRFPPKEEQAEGSPVMASSPRPSSLSFTAKLISKAARQLPVALMTPH